MPDSIADYPWAPTPAERRTFYDEIERDWGGPVGIERIAPSRAQDPGFRDWWATYQRRSASPSAALALAHMNTSIDVRSVLPDIRTPTLVIHRARDRDALVEEGRFIAESIPGAKFLELPGEDHLVFVGDQDAVLDSIGEFLGDSGPAQGKDEASPSGSPFTSPSLRRRA